MSIFRTNTLIVDFSVLPKRPDAAQVQKFLEKEIQLQLRDTTNIQLHNVRNCVFIQMIDSETALRYQNLYNNRRIVLCDGKEFKIPVYIEKESVTVRIHVLPPQMPHTTVLSFMQQYGTAISITRERWRHFFPGVYNGVRVLQMKLDHPIPSFVTINGEITLVTYRNQPKTCRFCGLAAHPKQKCARPPTTSTNNNPTEPQDDPKNDQIDATTTTAASSDSGPPTGVVDESEIVKQSKNNTENTIDDDDSSASNTFSEALVNQKRRLARLKERKTKKLCQEDTPEASITESNRFEALVELDWISLNDLKSISNSGGKGGRKC